jgi:hypothetical protein
VNDVARAVNGGSDIGTNNESTLSIDAVGDPLDAAFLVQQDANGRPSVSQRSAYEAASDASSPACASHRP